MTTQVLNSETCLPLGESIPLALPHAISVSLPTWRDTVGYEEGEKRVIDAMCTGYPRFVIHKSIRKLSSICERKFGLPGEISLLVPNASIANHCRDFLMAKSSDAGSPLSVRLAQFLIHSEESATSTPGGEKNMIALHIVLFPSEALPLAKQFWQHTGLGISSRMADRCLALLEEDSVSNPGNKAQHSPTSPVRSSFQPRNKHYAAKGPVAKHMRGSPTSDPVPASNQASENICGDQSTYVEERYGRNMALSGAAVAKRALRRRIAGVLVREEDASSSGKDGLQPSTRGVEGVTEDEVYLFPSGMSAIWNAHQLCLNALSPAKSVCFGFPYIDTLKILQKWGPGCHFFGNGTDADIDALASLLSSPDAPRVLALFCELPSNPLLRSVNLIRLRELADIHGFVIVVDETVGNFVNVEILPYADILASSLTKVFSGESNVMGGSLILNPKSRHFSALKAKIDETYEDVYWDEDAVYMERNSRDFAKRIRVINRNAETVCDFLRSQISVENPIVKHVYYPKWETRSNYDVCRITSAHGPDKQASGNFGGLFSVTFTSKIASEAFFDALPCTKGPSLGTNFTLACPYTILAHYTELEWAAGYGVEEGLVRLSVGLEDQKVLLAWVAHSLQKAEEAVLKAK